MTLSELIKAKGLDEKHEVRNLRRRLRYQSDPHASYVFADSSTVSLYAKNRYGNPDRQSYALSDLRMASVMNDVQLYVRSWLYLNGLTP